MADTKTSALTAYTTVLSGNDTVPILDTTNSTLKQISANNLNLTVVNQSVTSQSLSTTDVYLVGSSILIPGGAPSVGSVYHLVLDVVKSAGTGAPVITIRFGTAGSTADTSRCAFTFGIGTSVADTARYDIYCVFRTVGSSTSAVIQGNAQMVNSLTNTLTGFSGTTAIHAVQTTGGGFDSTVASSIIGASYNGGTAFAGTVQLVRAELIL